MKRELGIIAVVVAATLTLGPMLEVNASLIDPPTLDWFDVGHNFHYTLSNDTFEQEFNATIESVVGNELVFEFWVHKDGADKTVSRLWLNKSREDLNNTGAFTFMWVNSTNVDNLEAKIGAGTFDLIVTESTGSTLVFEDASGDRTFEFDASKGWLESASFRDLALNWHLVEVDDRDPSSHEPLPIEAEPCADETNFGMGRYTSYRWDADTEMLVSVGLVQIRELRAETWICIGELSSCDVKIVALSRVPWWSYLIEGVVPGIEYQHRWSVNGDTNGNYSGQVPIAIDLNRPLEMYYWHGVADSSWGAGTDFTVDSHLQTDEEVDPDPVFLDAQTSYSC